MAARLALMHRSGTSPDQSVSRWIATRTIPISVNTLASTAAARSNKPSPIGLGFRSGHMPIFARTINDNRGSVPAEMVIAHARIHCERK